MNDKQWILNIIAVVVLGTLLDMVIQWKYKNILVLYRLFYIGNFTYYKDDWKHTSINKDIWIRQLDAELKL